MDLMIHFLPLQKNNIIDILRSFERGGFGYGYASYDACANALIAAVNKNRLVADEPISKSLYFKNNYALTAREIQIVKLVCDGFLNKNIATSLGISERTVEFHITNIYKKTNITTRIGIAKYGLSIIGRDGIKMEIDSRVFKRNGGCKPKNLPG